MDTGFTEDRQVITVDDIVEIFVKTIGHWAYAWVAPAWFWFHNAYRIDSAVLLSIVYALIIDTLYALSWANVRYVSGKSCSINPKKDVVLITGGSHGLGRVLSALLATQGYPVACADISPPDFEVPGVLYYERDVSSYESVCKLREEIEHDLGPVTVLVNNAGTLKGSTWLVDMDPANVETILNTNLLSQFWTIKQFLPHMLKVNRGYIVTVASALGYIGPARASAYAASKAGLLGMHDSLTHEISRQPESSLVKTLLVTPGQLDTRMFERVHTPNGTVAPIVRTTDLALAIVNALEAGRGGTLSLPVYAKLLPLVKVLPGGLTDIARRVFGMDYAMDTYEDESEMDTYEDEPEMDTYEDELEN